MVFVVLRYCMTDVRDTTCSSGMSARLVRMSSWMPSVKNALSFSSLMLLNGSTARDFSLIAGVFCTGGSATAAVDTGTGATGVGGAAGRKTTKAPSARTATTSTATAHRGKPDLAGGGGTGAGMGFKG